MISLSQRTNISSFTHPDLVLKKRMLCLTSICEQLNIEHTLVVIDFKSRENIIWGANCNPQVSLCFCFPSWSVLTNFFPFFLTVVKVNYQLILIIKLSSEDFHIIGMFIYLGFNEYHVILEGVMSSFTKREIVSVDKIPHPLIWIMQIWFRCNVLSLIMS